MKPYTWEVLRYAISEGRLRHGDDAGAERLIARIGELAREGANFVLVREKQLATGELTRLARRAVARTSATTTRVLVPGRADIALAAGAAGVHLSSAAGELTPGQIRTVYPQAWVSLSCHSVDEVVRARQNGADAVLFAPVFGKMLNGLEVTPGVGLDGLRQACQAAGPMPVFALGGVTHLNAAVCGAAGAAGVAGIRMFFAEPHPLTI